MWNFALRVVARVVNEDDGKVCVCEVWGYMCDGKVWLNDFMFGELV